MSVRPLTNAEVSKAYGEPWGTLGGIFFGLQGFITVSSWNKVRAQLYSILHLLSPILNMLTPTLTYVLLV